MKAAAIAVLALLLQACAGTRLLAEYEHHSSFPDIADLNTTDQVGAVLEIPLRLRPEHCALAWCPSLELGLHWELGRPVVFGRNPVGTVRLRQPIWIRRE